MQGSAARLLPEALDTLPAAAYTCDGTGGITYYNRKAAALWGREPRLNDPQDRFCGSLRMFLPDGSPLPHDRCWMALALLEDRELLGNELIIERGDGSRVCALSNASPLHDASGALIGAIHVLVDITERKRRDASQAADQDDLLVAGRRKDEFLATLAHELRNPLAPLMQGLELLRRQKRDPRAVESVQNMMERQLMQLVRLIDDLLDVGRIGGGKFDIRPEPVNLADVVQLAVETTRCAIQKGGHQLHISLPCEALALNADLVRLAQVLTNLLNNSARYTQDGGRISLVVERDGGEAVIRVRDTGIGIRPAMLPNIFDLFTQVKADAARGGGLGVGLHIARRLVHLHGGTLTAHSAGEGMGSEFVVRLPLGNVAPEKTEVPMPKEGGPARALRVLVADDNPDVTGSLSALLGLMGHGTWQAHDGVQAVEVANSIRPDVVFLDIAMPRLDGYGAARLVRQGPCGARTLLVALSGHAQDMDRRQSRAAGFDRHLVKPLNSRMLKELLALAAERQREAGQRAGPP